MWRRFTWSRTESDYTLKCCDMTRGASHARLMLAYNNTSNQAIILVLHTTLTYTHWYYSVLFMSSWIWCHMQNMIRDRFLFSSFVKLSKSSNRSITSQRMCQYGSEFLKPPQLSSSGGRHFSEGAQGLAQWALSPYSVISHVAAELFTWSFISCQ